MLPAAVEVSLFEEDHVVVVPEAPTEVKLANVYVVSPDPVALSVWPK